MKICAVNRGLYLYVFDEGGLRRRFFPDYLVSGDVLEGHGEEQSYFDSPTLSLYARARQYAAAAESASALREVLKSDFEAQAGAKRAAWVLSNTSFVHEMRHFHDAVGTAIGLSRFDVVFQDVLRFLHAFREVATKLGHGCPKTLPCNWTQLDDSDSTTHEVHRPISEYVASHARTVESLALLDGSFFIPREQPNTRRRYTLVGFPDSQASGFSRGGYEKYKKRMEEYDVPDHVFQMAEGSQGHLLLLPGVPLNLQAGYAENVALGYRALTENNAWVTQYCFIVDVFGCEIADSVKSRLVNLRPPFQHPYMVVDLLISKHVRRFPVSLCTSLADYALNPDFSADFVSLHPGWRMVEFLKGQREERGDEGDIRLAGPLVDEVQLAGLETIIKTIAERADGVLEIAHKTNWGLLARIGRFGRYVATLGSRCLEARKSSHLLFGNPDTYLAESLEHLPLPPFIAVPDERLGGDLKAILLLDDKVACFDDVLAWFFTVNFIAALLHEDRLSCPVKLRHLHCPTKHEGCDQVPDGLEITRDCQFYCHLRMFGMDVRSVNDDSSTGCPLPGPP